MPRLEFTGADGRADHLDYNLYPPAGGWTTLVIYCHGLIATQGGEKATHLRAPVLAAGCGYATFDFRGHGASSRPLREVGLPDLVEDVARIVAHLHVPGRRVVLIGSSMGGWAASWYVAGAATPVAANFLIAPSLRLLNGVIAAQSPAELAAWRAAGSRRFPGPYGDYELGAHVIDECARYRFEDLAAGYRTPTVIVQGMQDASVPWEQALEFARAATGAAVDCLLLHDGDHRLTARKELLAALLVGFLHERGLA